MFTTMQNIIDHKKSNSVEENLFFLCSFIVIFFIFMDRIETKHNAVGLKIEQNNINILIWFHCIPSLHT